MGNRNLIAAVLTTVMMAANLFAQDLDKNPVKLSQSTTVRNGTISITVTNPPKINEGTIQLKGPGAIPPQAVALRQGTLDYTIPADAPLGQYLVTVKLGNLLFSPSELLSIAPALNWEPKLSLVTPRTTYKTEAVRLPDEKSQRRELKTVHLVLSGSGFLVDTPDDNQILINGEVQPVKWTNWTELPAADKPTSNIIHGRVVSPERIDLFRVPVLSDGTMLIAVKQGEKITEKQPCTVYRWATLPVALASAVIALLLALTVLALIHICVRRHPGDCEYNALKALFLDPETDTYSLSKLQFYLWTTAAIFGYAYLVISRILVQGAAWPEVPGGLPGIIAIGTGTAVGAQVVSNLRGPKGAGGECPNWGDFVMSGGVAAADRIQMLVWTILGVGIFCVSALQHAPGAIQQLDPVPEGMLTMMGLSAAGYLGGKFARKPGPVINEISITPPVSDTTRTTAAAPPPPPPPQLAQPVAEAQAVAAAFGVAPPGAQAAVSALTTAIAAANQVKTSAEAATLLPRLAELQAQAEAAAKTAADAFAQPGASTEAARAAEISQQAAAALQDLAAAISSLISTALAPALPGAAPLNFKRSIELRGRNLSADALFEIDGVPLSFQMLARNAEGKRLPEVVIREANNPTLARVLRLSIDPGQLETADFQLYKGWFGVPCEKKTFSHFSPDGQRSDIGFTIT